MSGRVAHEVGHQLRATVVVAVVCVSALVAGSSVFVAAVRDALPDRSPAQAARAAADRDPASGRLASEVPAEATYETAWHEDMLRDRRVVTELGTGRKIVDATTVNPTPDADLARTATECARDGARPGYISRCYVFASQAAYDFKNYDAKLPEQVDRATMAIVNVCWAVRAELPARAGAAPDVDDARAIDTWGPQGCPASWKGGN